MLTAISSTLAFVTSLSHEWAQACGLKSFPLQSLISSSMELLRTLHISACLCLLLVSVWCETLQWVLECGGRGGWGLLVLAFFYRPHRMQVSWLQVLSVLWQVLCAVLFQSAAIRMHCDAPGVWLKKVVSRVFGVVVVGGGKAMSNRLECWGNGSLQL